MEQKEIISFSQKTKKEDAPEKSPEQIAEQSVLLERLSVIVRTISGKKDLEITTEVDPRTLIKYAMEGQDARKIWYRNTEYEPRTRKKIKELVHIPKEITENENAAKGKAAHEAGHVAITRFGEFIPDEVLQELGFLSAINSVEERPTDQVIKERYSGAGKWIDEARQETVKETSFAVQGAEKMGYIPKFGQLCDLIVYEPHFEKIPDYYDPAIIDIYKKIKEHVEKTEKALPSEKSTDEEIIDKAKERYKITYSKIWPEIKKLVEDDSEREKLRQMIGENLKSKMAGEEQPDNPLNKLPKDLQKELTSAVKKLLEENLKKAIEKALSEKDGELGKKIKKESEEGKEEEKGEEEKESEGKPEIAGKKEAGRLEEKKPGKGGDEENMPVPMRKLSGELIKALKEIFDKLPKGKKEELKKKAEDSLKGLEDSIIGEISGKLLDMPPETHKEYEERMKREEEESEMSSEKEKAKEEIKEIERKQAVIRESAGLYDRTYEELRQISEELYRKLEEIFVPQIKRKVRMKTSGVKINLPAVFKWEADRGAGAKEIDNRIFESLHLPDKKDYAFTILVDLSGSMRGYEKIKETFKGVVLLAEVLNRLGVKNKILGFQDELIDFKDFDENLNDQIRKKMSGMIDEAYDRNPGGHNESRYNDDAPCLLEASKELDSVKSKEKFLVVFSDGVPAGRRSTSEDLTNAVNKIIKTTDQKLIGIGLGGGTEHVKTFYPNSLPNINVNKLPEVLGKLLEDMIVNFRKYAFSLKKP